jgi:uncharacterized protein (TIGR01244 family)
MRVTRVRTIASLLASVLPAALALGAGPTVSEIEKYFRPTERTATAAQPTIDQLSAVREEGFRTIINLREPSEHDAQAEEAAARRLGLRYVGIPVRTAAPKSEQVDAFLKVTDDPSIYPVLIHCGSGNRVGAFWMIRRVLVDGWTAEDAEKEARQIGMKSPNLKEFALEYIRAHPTAR